MKELDLMRALDGADDDILLEAERFELRPRRRLLPQIAAVVAVVALLCTTVYAVYSEARITFPNEENSILFQNLEIDGITYSHVEIEYDLQPVEIREEAVKFLTDMVDRAAGFWFLDGNELFDASPFGPHTFESIRMAENFFGLTFGLPEIVRESTVRDREISMEALPMYYPEELPPEEAILYEPDLGGAHLFFWVADPAGRIDGMYINIYIGLTEEYTAVPATGGWLSPLELLGEPEIQELHLGDEEFTFLTYADDPNNDVNVFYVRDGIGYSLSFHTAEGFTGDPVRLVRPYLEDLG